jgi:hypothetical protein
VHGGHAGGNRFPRAVSRLSPRDVSVQKQKPRRVAGAGS